MSEKAGFEKHFAALSAVFILGNAVIAMPYSSSVRQAPAAFLLSCAAAVILYGLAFFCMKKLCRARLRTGMQRTAALFFNIAVSVGALFTAAACFREFVHFVKSNLLPETPMAAIVLIFLLVIAFLAGKRQGVLLKFSLVAFLVAAAAILLFFVLSADQFDSSLLKDCRLLPLDGLWEQSLLHGKKLVFPALLLSVYQATAFCRPRSAGAFGGLAAGFVLLGLCFLNSVLIFGLPLAARLSYPYASAVSTVTIGQLFTRMDGASYFVYFAGCLIRVTVCIDIVKALVFRGMPKRNEPFLCQETTSAKTV